jgi:hypothetical protein
MPVFYFHLSGRGHYRRDDEGITFASVDEAYLEAYRAALDISFEMLRMRDDPDGHAFEITDEDGTVLIELPFSEVLHPHKRQPSSLPDGFHDSLRSQLARNRTLKADLSNQISAARDTLASTKLLLERSRMRASEHLA